jgi:hypothetical protein
MSPIKGDWSKDTVRLDFDNTPLDKVKYWANRACFWFKLEGFIILRSSIRNYIVKIKGKVVHRYSEASYLVIFNRKVKWDLNVRIMAWVAIQARIQSLKDYVLMQCIKRSSTVRCGSKGKKPSPKVVFRYGKQDDQVIQYLETRNFIKDFEEKNER